MKTIAKFKLLVFIILVSACNNDTSLQKYIVEKQNDNAFISLDIPSSIIVAEENNLSENDLKTIQTIKKINMIALQLKGENAIQYELEKRRVQKILKNDKYQTLVKYGSNEMGAALYFTGEVDAINELIVFATDEKKGMGLFRVLGNQMNPSQVVKLMNQVNTSNFDLSFMNELGGLLN